MWFETYIEELCKTMILQMREGKVFYASIKLVMVTPVNSDVMYI